MRARPGIALCLAVIIAASGCGSTRTATSSRESVLARGRAVFARSCSACHTLTGHDRVAIGGDLVHPYMTVADLASFARVMPVTPPLSHSEVTAVAKWVYSVAQSHH